MDSLIMSKEVDLMDSLIPTEKEVILARPFPER